MQADAQREPIAVILEGLYALFDDRDGRLLFTNSSILTLLHRIDFEFSKRPGQHDELVARWPEFARELRSDITKLASNAQNFVAFDGRQMLVVTETIGSEVQLRCPAPPEY